MWSGSHSNCFILVVIALGTHCIGKRASLRALMDDMEKRKISACIRDQTLVPQ
jgi:hypothetical protein